MNLPGETSRGELFFFSMFWHCLKAFHLRNSGLFSFLDTEWKFCCPFCGPRRARRKNIPNIRNLVNKSNPSEFSHILSHCNQVFFLLSWLICVNVKLTKPGSISKKIRLAFLLRTQCEECVQIYLHKPRAIYRKYEKRTVYGPLMTSFKHRNSQWILPDSKYRV